MREGYIRLRLGRPGLRRCCSTIIWGVEWIVKRQVEVWLDVAGIRSSDRVVMRFDERWVVCFRELDLDLLLLGVTLAELVVNVSDTCIGHLQKSFWGQLIVGRQNACCLFAWYRGPWKDRGWVCSWDTIFLIKLYTLERYNFLESRWLPDGQAEFAILGRISVRVLLRCCRSQTDPCGTAVNSSSEFHRRSGCEAPYFWLDAQLLQASNYSLLLECLFSLLSRRFLGNMSIWGQETLFDASRGGLCRCSAHNREHRLGAANHGVYGGLDVPRLGGFSLFICTSAFFDEILSCTVLLSFLLYLFLRLKVVSTYWAIQAMGI